jgi:hypothetical protein
MATVKGTCNLEETYATNTETVKKVSKVTNSGSANIDCVEPPSSEIVPRHQYTAKLEDHQVGKRRMGAFDGGSAAFREVADGKEVDRNDRCSSSAHLTTEPTSGACQVA